MRYLKDQLSRFQRMAWLRAHGEGWALYAERLMDELGYFENPDYRLGFLRGPGHAGGPGGRRHRHAPRVEHRRRRPGSIPVNGGRRSSGRSSCSNGAASPGTSWPASSTAISGGPRRPPVTSWAKGCGSALVTMSSTACGATFDQKAFHAYALGLGPIGLDQLASEVAAFAEQGQASSPAKAQA